MKEFRWSEHFPVKINTVSIPYFEKHDRSLLQLKASITAVLLFILICLKVILHVYFYVTLHKTSIKMLGNTQNRETVRKRKKKVLLFQRLASLYII